MFAKTFQLPRGGGSVGVVSVHVHALDTQRKAVPVCVCKVAKRQESVISTDFVSTVDSDAEHKQRQHGSRVPCQQHRLQENLAQPAVQIQQGMEGQNTVGIGSNGEPLTSAAGRQQLVVAAAAVAAAPPPDADLATPAAISSDVLAELRRSLSKSVALNVEDGVDDGTDVYSSDHQGADAGVVPDSSNSSSNTASSSTASSSTSALRERLRLRVAARTSSAAVEDHDTKATLDHPQEQPSTIPAVRQNNTRIDNVLQALQQRRERGYTPPGTKPGAAKAATTSKAPDITLSSSSSSSSGTGLDASRKRQPAMPPSPTAALPVSAKESLVAEGARRQPKGQGSRRQKAASVTAATAAAGSVTAQAPSAIAIKRALNSKRRSAENFAVLQQAAQAAVQHAADVPEPLSSHQPVQHQHSPEAAATTADALSNILAAQADSSSSSSSGPDHQQQRMAKKQHKQRAQQAPGRVTSVSPDIVSVLEACGAPDPVFRRLLHLCDSIQGVSSPQDLQKKLMSYETATQLLGGPTRTLEILTRDPSIMLMDPAVVAARLEKLQELFFLGAEQTAQPSEERQLSEATVTADFQESPLQEFQVLSRQQHQQHEQQQQQQQQQQAVCQDVLSVVTSHPGILKLNPDRLEARLIGLQDCLGMSSRGEVLQVVRTQSRILSMAQSSIKLKAIALASVITVPPAVIQDILNKQPLLLNLSAKTLVRKTRALKALLQYSDLQLWQMVVTKPGVLLFAEDKLSAKWQRLQKLAGTHPRWSRELQQLSPSSLVQLLTASEARLSRLEYLSVLQRQDKWALYNVVSGVPQARFLSQFPKYTAWVAAQGEQAAV